MAKEQLTYRSYTTSQLKSRSTIPAQVDITEDTGKIRCNNITTAQIRNAISASTNRVKDLCTHNNINRWSAFSPIKRSVSNGWLVNSVPTSNYKMGDFMGYNHNAVAPHYDVSGSNETVTVNPNGSFVFHCKADIGEIRYNDIVGKNPGTHVAFSVWKGQTYIDSRVKAISGMTNIADFDTSAEDRITVSDINDTSVYTCKIEILDSPSYDYQGGNTICQVPGLKNWTTTIYVRAANHFYISAPYASFPP